MVTSAQLSPLQSKMHMAHDLSVIYANLTNCNEI